MAAEPKPLQLTTSAAGVGAPRSPATGCDSGSLLNCGSVSYSLTFAGLSGRGLEATTDRGTLIGQLNGTVRVTRTYGCQSASGERLPAYDVKVREVLRLATRRDMPVVYFSGDTLTAGVHAFFPDSQPGNCPAGTTAMTYAFTARAAKVTFESSVDSIRSKRYSLCGTERWEGEVPTPVG